MFLTRRGTPVVSDLISPKAGSVSGLTHPSVSLRSPTHEVGCPTAMGLNSLESEHLEFQQPKPLSSPLVPQGPSGTRSANAPTRSVTHVFGIGLCRESYLRFGLVLPLLRGEVGEGV